MNMICKSMESANCVVDVLWPTALSALALFWRLGWILIAVYVYRAPVRGGSCPVWTGTCGGPFTGVPG